MLYTSYWKSWFLVCLCFASSLCAMTRVELALDSPLLPIAYGVDAPEKEKHSIETALSYDIATSGWTTTAPTPAHFSWEKPQEGPFAYLALRWIDGMLHYRAWSIDRTPPSTGVVPVKKQRLRYAVHQLFDAIVSKWTGREILQSARIIFLKSTRTQHGVTRGYLWQCDIDGGTPALVTSGKHLSLTPTLWSNWLLYAQYSHDRSRIVARHLKSKKEHHVVHAPGNQMMPTISPDGQWLAYISDQRGKPEVYVQRIDLEKNRVAQPHAAWSKRYGLQASPAFSPDGKLLAFVSNIRGYPQIFTIPFSKLPTSETEATCISRKGLSSVSPSWSPDGRYIAYSGLVDGYRQIFLYDFWTNQTAQCTSHPGNKEQPTWSAQGEWLLYNSYSGDKSVLERCHVQTGIFQPINLTTTNARYPIWLVQSSCTN